MSRYLKIALVLLILVPLGFSTKFYHGPLAGWVNNGAGDILYPIFWFFLLIAVFPKMSCAAAAFSVFLFSSAIEGTQLFKWPVLVLLRQSFIGRTIVGSGFEWVDFLYYAIGSLTAFILGRKLLKSPESN